MSRLENEILLNQIAQGVRPLEDGLKLLAEISPMTRKELWSLLGMMVTQAHPTLEDVEEAIKSSNLKPSFTPCVLMLKDQRPHQVQRITQLPENEAEKSFRLLIAVFAIADRRRRSSCPKDCCHGWHRDFGDPSILKEIRKRGYI
jgi:hypothetical protein